MIHVYFLLRTRRKLFKTAEISLIRVFKEFNYKKLSLNLNKTVFIAFYISYVPIFPTNKIKVYSGSNKHSTCNI